MTLFPALVSPLFALAPATVAWSPKVGLVMILCNVMAIAIGQSHHQVPQ